MSDSQESLDQEIERLNREMDERERKTGSPFVEAPGPRVQVEKKEEPVAKVEPEVKTEPVKPDDKPLEPPKDEKKELPPVDDEVTVLKKQLASTQKALNDTKVDLEARAIAEKKWRGQQAKLERELTKRDLVANQPPILEDADGLRAGVKHILLEEQIAAQEAAEKAAEPPPKVDEQPDPAAGWKRDFVRASKQAPTYLEKPDFMAKVKAEAERVGPTVWADPLEAAGIVNDLILAEKEVEIRGRVEATLAEGKKKALMSVPGGAGDKPGDQVKVEKELSDDELLLAHERALKNRR